MAGFDIVAYAAAKKFTEETADTLGSLKGAPATIKSITDIEGGHRVTFAWTGASGTEQAQTMDMMDGAYHEDRAAGVSLDGYATEQYVDDGLATKQDTLVSGTNVKTVNGESLLGAGNIVAGMNLEVGVEKWYGTYTADGVTYQVYSKLLDIGALPSAAGVTQYPHGITGIKQILQISGFTNDGFVMNAPRQNAQDNISIYQAQKSGNIAVEVGKDRSSKSGFVMLIYAKNN